MMMRMVFGLMVTLLLANAAAAARNVGVNYHATGPDFERTAFLTRYHVPAVREEVRRQLSGMANSGVDAVKTTIWLTADGLDGKSDALPPQPANRSFAHHFPLTPRERANLRRYVEDVAALRRPDGSRVRLQLAMAWLWCGDFTTGDPRTTVGRCGLTWSEFLSRARLSAAAVLDAAAIRSGGRPAAERVYLTTETMIGAKRNEERFLLDLYAWFTVEARRRGIEGSVYFLIPASQREVFDDGFRDVDFPALDGHRSLFWMSRSTEFMRKNGLPLPEPLSFSLYPEAGERPLKEVVARVFADLRALYPRRRYAISETDYPADPARRRALGQAFGALPAAAGLEDVFVWPAPNSYGPASAYPFDLTLFGRLDQR